MNEGRGEQLLILFCILPVSVEIEIQISVTAAITSSIAFTFLVYPCLMLAYMGEAAFLSTHHQDIQQSFYKAIPGKFDSNIAVF
ncbi:hypothetical protein MRB53_000610 [Persea americana]|uniref:Uncharacterized protein n=1 Tax=Persea americana TaxID=3435 RepID=A0ACC2MPC6_PERAE|nr:hypothetical protein MRB53_000610 [Persea americana]